MRPILALAILLILPAAPARADSYSSWSAKAVKAEKKGDTEDAMQAWSNAIRLWKASDGKKARARAFEARASLHEKNSAPDKAVMDLSAALKLDDKNAKLFHRRGKLLFDQGKVPEAIADFYKATSLKLDFAEAFFDRARAYELQGEALFAGEDYRAACDLGFKKACAKVPAKKGKKAKPVAKKGKKGKKKASPAEESDAKDEEPQPETPQVEEIPAETGGEEQEPGGADIQACADSVSKCAEEEDGATFTSCVAKARLCEESPKRGCCPQACVKQFKRALDRQSEAQAFREIFVPGHACGG